VPRPRSMHDCMCQEVLQEDKHMLLPLGEILYACTQDLGMLALRGQHISAAVLQQPTCIGEARLSVRH
jgi:hypothetical protein